MPRRRTGALQENLKALFGSNGLAWAEQDHVLPKRAQDVVVRQGLHNLLGLAAPLRRADVQAEMITVFEQATRLFFEKRGRGQEINEVDFVREVWAGHRLYLHLGDYYFAQLFTALLRARSEYHEGKFQRAPQPPLLGSKFIPVLLISRFVRQVFPLLFTLSLDLRFSLSDIILSPPPFRPRVVSILLALRHGPSPHLN